MKLLHLLLNGWICGKHGLVLLYGFWLHGEGVDVGHRPVRIHLVEHLRGRLHCYTMNEARICQ